MKQGGKGITDMLNLPELSEIFGEDAIEEAATTHASQSVSAPELEVREQPQENSIAISMMETFEHDLKKVGGESHAKNLDTIAKETLDHSRTLMDLAYNVDDRSRRGILEIATAMYKNTIDANNSKRDYELKLLKLLQDQRKLDLEERKFKASKGEKEIPDAEVTEIREQPVMADRNELLSKRASLENKSEKD